MKRTLLLFLVAFWLVAIGAVGLALLAADVNAALLSFGILALVAWLYYDLWFRRKTY